MFVLLITLDLDEQYLYTELEYTYALLMKEFELLILDSNHLLIVC